MQHKKQHFQTNSLPSFVRLDMQRIQYTYSIYYIQYNAAYLVLKFENNYVINIATSIATSL